MKIFISILLILHFVILNASAQIPDSIHYQAIVRNSQGNILPNTAVGVQMSIVQNNTIVYQESHSTSTNNFGLINLIIGGGIVNQGNMAEINWGVGPVFIRIGIDPLGGTNYSLIMGETQFLSVPYALYSKNSGLQLPDDPLNGLVCFSEMSVELLDIDPPKVFDGIERNAGVMVYPSQFLGSHTSGNFKIIKPSKIGPGPDYSLADDHIFLTCDELGILEITIIEIDQNNQIINTCESSIDVRDSGSHCNN